MSSIISAIAERNVVPILREVLRHCILSLALSITTISSANNIQSPAMNDKDAIWLGLHIRSITGVDEIAQTFTADLDLWLRYNTDVTAPSLTFPDAIKPVELINPVAQLDQNNEHYRLYHIQPTFHYTINQIDLIKRQRQLIIRCSLERSAANNLLLKLDYTGMGMINGDNQNWLKQLRVENTLANLKGWTLQDSTLTTTNIAYSVLGDPRYANPLLDHQVIVATLLAAIPTNISPRIILSTLLPITSYFAVNWIALITLFGIWIALRNQLNAKMWLVAKLSIGTLVLYFIEPFIIPIVINWLSLNAMERLLILLDTVWWFVPAIWLQAALPRLVWQPLNEHLGNPIPSITRILVPIMAYLFSMVMAMYFSWGQSLASVGVASGMFTIILGVSLRGLILDLFAGILINMEQPFKILNRINIGGQQEGQVVDMNWRATRLRTGANNLIFIPNSHIARSIITNYSLPSTPSMFEFPLMLDTVIPVKQLRKNIKDALLVAAKHGRLLAEPQPKVVMNASKEHGIYYRVQFYVDLALVSKAAALTDAIEAVTERLAQDGIQAINSVKLGLTENRTMKEHTASLLNVDKDVSMADKPAPLTQEEIELIKASWNKVMPIASKAAALFYGRLFELDPSVKPLFRTSAMVQQGKLIGMLNLMVRSLETLDDLVPILQDLGMRHASYGIKDQHFDTVGNALIWTLEKGLGAEFTPQVKSAWIKIYTLAAATMKIAK